MAKEVRIAIISSDLVVSQGLEKILTQQFKMLRDTELRLKVFTHLPSLEDAVVHFAPKILVVHVADNEKEEKLAYLSQLTRVSARIPIVVCTSEFESDFVLSCVKRGANDFIHFPLNDVEIRETMARLLEKASFDTQLQRLGPIYTFFSYKGGVGTTFLACNTAVALQRITGKNVLLWDMVLQNGDVPFFLDYEPKMTISELMESVDAIDGPFLQSALPLHESGIAILAAPRRPEEAEAISHEQVHQLYQVLRKYYDFIVVDGGHAFTDPVITVMDACHYIIFPTDLHLPVLKNTLRCIEVFEKFGYVEEKFKIVVNRYNARYEEIDLEKAGKILPYPITYAFANDYMAASRSLNTGIPIVDLDKRSNLTRQFREFAQLLVSGFEKRPAGKPSVMKNLFGGLKKK